ncbi:MAG: ribosome maturation factor RimM [Anaerolineaceae bacterium]
MPDPEKYHAGSPAKGEPVFLAIGRLRSAHGVHGEINLEIWTDFPERIKAGNSLYLGDDRQEVIVTAVRGKNRLLLLSLQGYDVRESVNTLRNQIVYTQTANLPKLPPGQYYHHELVGLHVVDENDVEIGMIQDILVTGANDVLVLSDHGKELLIPLIKDVVLSIDLTAGLVKVKPPNWD